MRASAHAKGQGPAPAVSSTQRRADLQRVCIVFCDLSSPAEGEKKACLIDRSATRWGGKFFFSCGGTKTRRNVRMRLVPAQHVCSISKASSRIRQTISSAMWCKGQHRRGHRFDHACLHWAVSRSLWTEVWLTRHEERAELVELLLLDVRHGSMQSCKILREGERHSLEGCSRCFLPSLSSLCSAKR